MMTFLLALLACLAILYKTSLSADGLMVNITILQSATTQGAVCLDGSPPAYYIDRGFDTGLSKWIVHLQGGGWCESIPLCKNHTNSELGSSKHMKNQAEFGGILHNSPQKNPDFYNWNRVWVNYCDGSSFTGDVEQVNPEDKLYFRGARIFKAVLEDLWSKGMQNAENAILSGSSAGGLATILNCDKFKSFFPSDSVKVKCVANAGFFININTTTGTPYIQNTYQKVVDLHESAKNLPPSCTTLMEPTMCFFPQHVLPYVETPLFIINSAYDSWQINNILVPSNPDSQGAWQNCNIRISDCTSSQRTTIKGFGVEFLKTFLGLPPCYTRGYFINSCRAHPDIVWDKYWYGNVSILNKTIGEAVGAWYFDRTGFHQHIDPHPFARDC